MIKRVWCLFFALIFIGQYPHAHLHARYIASSRPYLSGDTFRAICEFHYDEVTTSFDPADVKPGDCVFVKTDMLESYFASKHPSIQNPYIIISHNSDHPAPGPCVRYLDDPKIVAWFAQNVEVIHPKLHPIPIGVANPMWPHGNVAILAHCESRKGSVPRDRGVYVNLSVWTYPGERQRVCNLLADKPYAYFSGQKSFEGYLLDLLTVRFVASPRGNGLDCHRTWEALYMGAIPIVRRSNMDAAFKNLPVLIVDDWTEISESFLEEQYEKIKAHSYRDEKLYADFWEKKIQKYRRKAQKTEVK
jgi:hypothetical protein